MLKPIEKKKITLAEHKEIALCLRNLRYSIMGSIESQRRKADGKREEKIMGCLTTLLSEMEELMYRDHKGEMSDNELLSVYYGSLDEKKTA